MHCKTFCTSPAIIGIKSFKVDFEVNVVIIMSHICSHVESVVIEASVVHLILIETGVVSCQRLSLMH